MHKLALRALVCIGGGFLAGAACADVLVDQSGSCSNTSTTSEIDPSQKYYEARVADDLVIPARTDWVISAITVSGSYFSLDTVTEARSFNVFFYEDAAGLPGASLCAYYNLAYTQTGDQFSIDLPSHAFCTLSGRETGARTWVSVQANNYPGSTTDWGWADRTQLSGNPAVVEYPGGVECPAWGTKSACIGEFETTTPDQCFALSGSSAATSPAAAGVLFGSSSLVTNGEFSSFYASTNVVSNALQSGRLADDFYVPKDTLWAVTQVAVPGKYTYQSVEKADSFNLVFFENANGIPGSPVADCSFAGIPFTEDSPVFTLDPPQTCVLAGGPDGARYWVSVQANLSTSQNTLWYWNQRFSEFNSPAAREVAGGAAGPDCIPWNSMSNAIEFPSPCSSVELPNLQFALLGVSSEIFRDGFDH